MHTLRLILHVCTSYQQGKHHCRDPTVPKGAVLVMKIIGKYNLIIPPIQMAISRLAATQMLPHQPLPLNPGKMTIIHGIKLLYNEKHFLTNSKTQLPYVTHTELV